MSIGSSAINNTDDNIDWIEAIIEQDLDKPRLLEFLNELKESLIRESNDYRRELGWNQREE